MTHDEERRRIKRLRNWVLVLTIAVLTGAVAAPIVGSAIVDKQTAETQLVVTCTSAKASVEELTALNEIADRLGIPHEFVVPEVPVECDS